MTIGPDIKEAIVEVGTKFTIVRDSGNVTGEYLTSASNAQVLSALTGLIISKMNRIIKLNPDIIIPLFI